MNRRQLRLSQFADFINAVSGERPSNQRLGQWAFNILNESYPDIALEIRATHADPFYDDQRMVAFLDRLLMAYVTEIDL